MLRGVRVQLRAVDSQHRHADQTGVRAERQHVAEQAGQRRLVTLAKARDRAVIRPLVRGDHPERHIVDTGPLDHPRRTPPHGIRVKQQRHHHRRIVRRPPVPVLPVSRIERRQVHLRHGVDHKPRQMAVRQPLAQARRQQQLLLTVTRNEVLGHHRIVLTGPDDTPRLCNSHHGKQSGAARRRLGQAAWCLPSRAVLAGSAEVTTMLPPHRAAASEPRRRRPRSRPMCRTPGWRASRRPQVAQLDDERPSSPAARRGAIARARHHQRGASGRQEQRARRRRLE